MNIKDFIKKKLQKKKIVFSKIEFLTGDASNRKYFTLKKNNYENLLIMFDDNKKSFNSFIKISNLLKDKVSVPQIYDIFDNSNFLILENFGNLKYSQLLNKNNSKKLYTIAIEAIINLQISKFKTNLPSYKKIDFINESKLFFEWYLPLNLKKKDPVIINEFELLMNSLLDKALSVPEVFVHKDYHIDNLFFLEERKKHFKCGWIDYQDAVLGPCVYDVVSLTQDARIDVSENLESFIVEYYLNKFKKLSQKKFFYSYYLIAIQRHLKVLGIFARLSKRDKKPSYLKHIPRVKKLLKKNLDIVEFYDLNRLLKSLV